MMRKRIAVIGMLGALLGLSGCKLGDTSFLFSSGMDENEVFQINEAVCTLPEAKVYLCNYQNIYGSAYGINLWEQETADKSLETYVKEITITELTRVVCMDELAVQREIVLSEEEEQKAKEAAAAYYKSLTEEEISYMEVSEELLTEMYCDYALAQKLYISLTAEVNGEVSDDEARIMEAQQIFVSTKEKADEVKKELKNGKDFLSVAADYNEAPKIEITFGRGDMPKEVEEAAFDIENEEITKCIKTEAGYYYIKCINKFNQELTDERKHTIVKQRETEAFDNTYHTFLETLDSTLNKSVWDSVEVKQHKDISTDSFFEVYEEYFK